MSLQKTFFIGVDVSKSSLDVAFCTSPNEIIAFKKFLNNQQGFKKIEQLTKTLAAKYECLDVHFCMEATNIYSDALGEFLQDKGFKVSIMNPAQTKFFCKSLMIRTKTDKTDAEALAFYCCIMKPKVTPKTSDEVKRFRGLVREREYLVRDRAKEKSKLDSVQDEFVRKITNSLIAHYDLLIKEIDKEIKAHARTYLHLQEKLELLKTIPGISDVTSQLFLSEIHIHEEEKLCVKSQTAHAGLAPQQFQSGTSVRGRSRINKTGNARLRTCLYMPTLNAIRTNPIIKEFYKRLLENGKPKIVAIVACMRKLLTLMIGVINNNSAFDPNWSKNRVVLVGC